MNRFSQRLIGPFDYAHSGRSFDGGQIGYATPKINLTRVGFIATHGGFEVDANRELDIDVAGVALSLPDSPELGFTLGRFFWNALIPESACSAYGVQVVTCSHVTA